MCKLALLLLLSLLLRLGALSLSLLVSSRIWVRRLSFLNNLKVAASLNFAECVFNECILPLREDLSFSENRSSGYFLFIIRVDIYCNFIN